MPIAFPQWPKAWLYRDKELVPGLGLVYFVGASSLFPLMCLFILNNNCFDNAFESQRIYLVYSRLHSMQGFIDLSSSLKTSRQRSQALKVCDFAWMCWFKADHSSNLSSDGSLTPFFLQSTNNTWFEKQGIALGVYLFQCQYNCKILNLKYNISVRNGDAKYYKTHINLGGEEAKLNESPSPIHKHPWALLCINACQVAGRRQAAISTAKFDNMDEAQRITFCCAPSLHQDLVDFCFSIFSGGLYFLACTDQYGIHHTGIAFADIVLLWFAIAGTIYLFSHVDLAAAYLLVPYIFCYLLLIEPHLVAEVTNSISVESVIPLPHSPYTL
eukprot:Gb_14870 [translate_table: standard]